MQNDETKDIAAGPRSQAPSSLNSGALKPNDVEPLSQAAISDRSLKQLNDNLAIVIRFLHKNVGRPWSQVHAELSKMISASGAVHRLLLDRLGDLVATSVVMIDGKPHRAAAGAERSQVRPLKGTKWDSLYVCPRTGVLRSVERVRELLQRPDPNVKPAGPLSQYRRINGAWYHVELAFIPSLPGAMGSHYDVLLHAPVADISSETIRKTYGSYDRYAVAKRLLTKRELQRLADEISEDT